MEITLKDERPVLTVNIGEEKKRVPLTFNRAEYIGLGKAEDKREATEDFFRKYIGEVYDELGDDDVALLLDTWQRERMALGTPTLGEL